MSEIQSTALGPASPVADDPPRQDAQDISIAFVIDRFDRRTAGTEGQLFQLVHALCQRGADCRLLVLQPSDYLRENGFPCPWQVVGHDKISDPRSWFAMWRAGVRLRRQGVRLAHVYFNDASVLAPPTFSLAGIRTLISRRDMGFWYTPKYVRALRITRRWVAACIANSRAVGEETSRVERIPQRAVRVIYNGMTPAEPSGQPIPALDQLRGSGAVVAMLVANVRPIKRMEDLVDAIGRLRDTHPMLHAVIIGGGDAGALMQRAQALGVAERVHFPGPSDDVANCLTYADIGVLCSESEGFSNAIVEYMRAGLPTICTATGGNPEAVEDEASGLLYPVGDIARLAAGLARLTENTALGNALGNNARQSAEQRFSVDRMVQDHLKLYREMLQGL
ncbi:MAG: glycosyltransferase family 4 protein [Aquisalimonadaceae bacterium]